MSSITNEIISKIPSKISQFMKEDVFFDVTLISGNKKAQFHKIFLSNVSKWFYKYFYNHPTDEKMIELKLPCDPEFKFFDFLKSVYQNKIYLDNKNFALYLKYAKYYQMDDIAPLIDGFMMKNTTDENVLVIASQLTELGLDLECLKHAKRIAHIFENSLKTKEEIFSAISPTVLAEVLQNMHTNSEQRIVIIDKYFEFTQKTPTPTEQEQLASTIDWSKPDSYLFLVNHNCDWAPPSLTRPFYIRALTHRQKTKRAFARDCEKAGDTVSRMFLLGWIDALSSTRTTEETPVVDALKLAGSFNGIVEPFNPSQFGLIELVGTPSISPRFDLQNAIVDDQTYFLSKDGDAVKLPHVVVSFGRSAAFLPRSVHVDSRLVRDIPKKSYSEGPRMQTASLRAAPREAVVEGGRGSAFPDRVLCERAEFVDGVCDAAVEADSPVSSVKVTMRSSSTAFWWSLRIRYLDFKGQFLPR